MDRRRHLIGLTTSLALLAGAGAALAQEKPATPRQADLLTGVLLYCWSVVGEPWTKDLCAALDKEAAALSKAANIRFVALATSDTDATNKQKARDAGFDPAHALWVLFKVERTPPPGKGWALKVSADSIAIPQPGFEGQQIRVVYTQSALLAANISRKDADAAGKTLVQGLYSYLSRPRSLPGK